MHMVIFFLINSARHLCFISFILCVALQITPQLPPLPPCLSSFLLPAPYPLPLKVFLAGNLPRLYEPRARLGPVGATVARTADKHCRAGWRLGRRGRLDGCAERGREAACCGQCSRQSSLSRQSCLSWLMKGKELATTVVGTLTGCAVA